MVRKFSNHEKRKVEVLDGFWLFTIDGDNVGESEKWQEKGFEGKSAFVPSCWNTDLGLLNYEGVCWYEKEFFFEGGTLRLEFGAVMTSAKVYFDGKYLGEHYGGFTAFSFIVENATKGYHKVTVRVDNSFDDNSIPQKKVDWFHYGGITRSVTAEKIDGLVVMHNRFNYALCGDQATCDFDLQLYNATDESIEDEVKIYLDGEQKTTITVKVEARATVTVKTDRFTVEKVRLWSVKSPNLYGVKIVTTTDDLFDRVGFRTIEVKNKKIYLNGEEFVFTGVNRHEENTENGMAFPPSLMQRDIDIIKQMNCNAIRGSHYPNNQIFVDMLDEQGLAFWSEIPIWGCGFSTEALANPVVIERGLTMLKEMVKQYCNHPSILMWGMHNEIKTATTEGYEMSKVYYDYLKSVDDGRLIVFASMRPLEDICYEFCDVVCFNLYNGWYYSEIDSWDKLVTDLDEYLQKIGQSDKPIIASEFGAASIYGYRTFDDIRWTEEYQSRLFDYTIDLFLNKSGYAGTFIWQFANIRTYQGVDLNRARGYNNKGVVDEYRRPKSAYFTVKDAYAKFKK